MRKQISLWIAMVCIQFGGEPSAEAGAWIDSMLSPNRPIYPVGPAYPVGGTPVASNYGSVVANYGPYANTVPATSGVGAIPLGVPQTVGGYLPTASYDTVWSKTPVTYYRPVTSFDPRTGTTVTSLQPCTSVQYQAARVPLASPRPVLGEYGMQANRWPGITGPGYNPTGLVNTANYPSYQTLPTYGSPVAPAVSYGVSGSSMGMPPSSLPTSTFPTPIPSQPGIPTIPYSPSPFVPAVPYTSSYGQVPTSFVPATTVAPANHWVPAASATPVPGVSYAPTVSSYLPPTPMQTAPVVSSYPIPNTVPNATAGSVVPPGYAVPSCNGTYCPTPMSSISPQLSAPSMAPQSPATVVGPQIPASPVVPQIPGATSVTPVGPPTYSPVPSSTSGTVGPTLGTPAPNNFPSSGGVLPPSGSVLPPGGIYPPGSVDSSLQRDPEANRQPSLGSSAAITPPSVDQLVRNDGPVALGNQFKRPSTDFTNDEIAAPSLGNASKSNSEPGNARNLLDQMLSQPNSLTAPRTLPNEDAKTKESGLRAPDGVETAPRWNPTTIDEEDHVARTSASGVERRPRITTAEDEDASSLLLVSGVDRISKMPRMLNREVETSPASQNNGIRFEPR